MRNKYMGSRKTLPISTGVLTMLVALLVVPPVSAANECISQKAKDALTCSQGKSAITMSKRQQVTLPKTRMDSQKPKVEGPPKPPKPPQNQSISQRDLRRQRLEPKRWNLIVTEIQGLESLFQTTPKNAPDRPKLMRRLAEGYVELESAAFVYKTESSIKSDEAKRKKQPTVARFKAEAAKADKILVAARQAAIKYYVMLKTQYPNYCQSNNPADPGCTDEVLYYLAYEYEQDNKLEDARKVYFELIQNWPKSKYIPNAYLAFGELFFNEAQGDPTKWEVAEKSYLEVIKYPPPDNKVFGYAHYKLGYVYWNKGDFTRALNEFKKTIDHGQQYPKLSGASQLVAPARRDIVVVYALAGDPLKAFDFFQPLSGDSSGSYENSYKMMHELGQTFLDTGHYKEGITLYQDLIRRDKGSRLCDYQSRITQATMAMKSGDKPAIMNAFADQIERYKKFQTEDHPQDAKLQCANSTAELVTETAMSWHLEVVGSSGVRGTGDKKTAALAAELYEKVVANFTSEQFAKFEFPRIIKEDWFTLLKVKYAMADLLYFLKDWKKCGPAFDAVVAEDPKGPMAPPSAYVAVLCYREIYLENHKDISDRVGRGTLSATSTSTEAERAKYLPKPLTEGQQNMIGAFDQYLCNIVPPPNDKEAQEQYVEVKYARARTYFEAQHWEESALAFRDIALNHSKQDAGIYAAQLYLESTNVLGTHSDPPKTSCYDDMAKDVPTFIDLYCKDGKEKDNAEQCTILARIQRDTEWLACDNQIKQTDATTGPDAPKMYEKAAMCYMNLWKKYGEGACETKQPGCNRQEDVLYNAARAFQAARLIAKAIATRKILIDPKYNLHQTDRARKAVYEIGGNYQAIAVYDEAASWFERFARESPKMDKASLALQDAVVLRLGLGQEDLAIKDADLFSKSYGRSQPEQAAHVAFAIGAHFIERQDWSEAKRRLTSAMSMLDRHATFDVQVQAHAMLGRVHTKLNDPRNATAEYNKVRAYWKDPVAGKKKLDALKDDEPDSLRRVAKVVTAVGEANFFFAEVLRKEAEKVRFPEYKGSGTRDDVLRHINTKVMDWVKKKRAAIAEAEKQYLQVVQLEPEPPPSWVIASGSRVGQMWGKFVAEFRAAPIPKEWKGHGIVPGTTDLTYDELRIEYFDKLDKASEPQRQQAKAAYRTCLDYSVKYQHFDEYSRSCEVWLSKNYGSEFHLIDEFRASPSRVNSGLSEQAAPLSLGGSRYRNEDRGIKSDGKDG